MFEITAQDISLLNDEDLRSVVGRLCEAELRRKGHSPSHATWGGNQTAKDGGLDVRVSLPAIAEITGFIPKPETGLQVKKPDMPHKAIIEEMKPEGVLRQVILELIKASGAYIIVSSTGSTADSALQNRKKTMAEAIQGVPGAANLTLDFYDRNRIATWVRDHAGLIPWVRSLVGKAVPGWQSFGTWSYAPSGADDPYLFDDEARIRTGDKDEGDGLSAIEGINRIRDALREPGHVVRLVGLSGVGKTRLCEALFDAKIGKDSLDPSYAIYTNVAEGPNPPPVGLASDLIAGQTRAILVVDNCPFELHRHLRDLARAANSTISVITIEYDIRDDQPEGTDVFALDTSSLPLIEKLVQRRYPAISQIDAQTIADFSGGNARVALALAATVGKNESVSGLSDVDLFKRLFQQRHEHDPDLLLIAQACSLVYSFEGVKINGEGAELPILAGLVGRSVQEVYAAVAELKRRDLLQERAEWRAVLPHAVANRLATLALQNIPADIIKDALITHAPMRLLRSFSRRLGYLDGSEEAVLIVENWLAPGGMLADIPNLGEDERAMLANIAPVAPDAVLTAIELASSGADKTILEKSSYVAPLLRSLAYDPEQFERAVALLIKLAQTTDTSEIRESDTVSFLVSLFHIVLSGTHATVEMRVKVLQGLLQSNDDGLRAMGVKALDAMLKSDHFTSSYGFEFGARSRDYGYHPSNGKDVQDWFDAVMAFASPLALSTSSAAPEVLKSVAGEFRGLWTNAGQADALELLSRQVATRGFWREGWIAARQTRIYEGKTLSADALGRLAAVEELLRPKDLVDQVEGLVLGSGGQFDFDDIEDLESDDTAGALARMDAIVEKLGVDVATDDEAFRTLLPRLMHGSSRVRLFGEGLADGTEKPYEVWQGFVMALATTSSASTSVMGGFLNRLQRRDTDLVDKLLDEALEQLPAAARFVELQASVTIDERGVKRLHRALDLAVAPINEFYALAYGQASDNIPGPAFRDLLLAIASKPEGNAVALEILSMRLFSDGSKKRQVGSEVAEAGRALLRKYEFRKQDDPAHREDDRLGRIVRISLEGDEGIPIARQIARDMIGAINRYDILAQRQDRLISALLQTHPTVALDEMFSGDTKAKRKATQIFGDLARARKCPLAFVPDQTLLEWCDHDPAVRYPLIAASSMLFKRSSDDKPYEWTSLSSNLLVNAPDPRSVLNEIVRRLHPTNWTGSLASALEGRLKLLERLPIADRPGLAEAFAEARAFLQKQIAAERKKEADEARSRSGRFE